MSAILLDLVDSRRRGAQISPDVPDRSPFAFHSMIRSKEAHEGQQGLGRNLAAGTPIRVPGVVLNPCPVRYLRHTN